MAGWVVSTVRELPNAMSTAIMPTLTTGAAGTSSAPGAAAAASAWVRIAAGAAHAGRPDPRGRLRSSPGSGGSGGGIYDRGRVPVRSRAPIDASGAVGNFGGGGGGGRIAVYAADFSGFDTSRITALGGAAYYNVPGSPGTVYVYQGIPHNHVESYEPVPINGVYINGPIAPLVLKFSVPIAVSAENAANIMVDGQMGHHVATGITQVGDRTYQIDFPRLDEDGPYYFTVLNTLLDINGNALDQNINQIPGELDDSDTFTLTIDTVPPRVTNHSPSGDVAGTIDHVDVWFSEAVDTTTFTTSDIAITKPNGQAVAATNIQNVGLNRFRISFAPQTLVGVYHVLVGPDVRDLAGNLLDQNQDGITGDPINDDVYDASFNLVPVDLALSNLVVSPAALVAGESVTITWSGSNQTGTPLVGDWTDGVYLSTDGIWDINDPLLGTVAHTGGLAAG